MRSPRPTRHARKRPSTVRPPLLAQQGKNVTPPDDIADWPDRYALVLDGAGLEPVLCSGARLVFDKTAACESGDLVVLHLRPHGGQARRMIVRLVHPPAPWVRFPYARSSTTEAKEVVVYATLSPPRQLACDCAGIIAMHKAVGVIADELFTTVWTDSPEEP